MKDQTIIQGDCLEVMKQLPNNYVDAIVTDPPYELGFMGKAWDNTGIANNKKMWAEALRVLKPGGHLLAFSGTRTYHRMAVAIEDAGFEVRDMIEWVYGSGFPKSLNIGKAVDKLQGNEREFAGYRVEPESGRVMALEPTAHKLKDESDERYGKDLRTRKEAKSLTKGTSEYEGWGTALKPAHEPICMARKPLAEKTVAENCLKWGTGGINIDESRVETSDNLNGGAYSKGEYNTDGKVLELGLKRQDGKYEQPIGRFPANLIHDNSEEVRECFPETTTNGVKTPFVGGASKGINLGGGNVKPYETNSGNASRFFKSIIYQAKASKSERNKGLEGRSPERSDYRLGDKNQNTIRERLHNSIPKTNPHPTVKPVALMEYLVKLVSREGAVILDPFAGSGSTGIACKLSGRNFIGIELDEEYSNIARKRIEAHQLVQEQIPL